MVSALGYECLMQYCLVYLMGSELEPECLMQCCLVYCLVFVLEFEYWKLYLKVFEMGSGLVFEY